MQEYIVKIYRRWEHDYGFAEVWRDKESNKFHRIGGLAITYWNGTKCYYKNGKKHREDGPAVIYSDGSEEYWLEGVKYTKEEFLKKTTKHTISIDGKEIEISGESFEALKASLNKEDKKEVKLCRSTGGEKIHIIQKDSSVVCFCGLWVGGDSYTGDISEATCKTCLKSYKKQNPT